jgi:pimeloyl-ACP methyl ester carboxylesterase
VKSIQVNGTDFYYLDRGNGLPMVFLHGFPFDHSMWQGQVEGLASRYRVIVPDLRGFGRSRSNDELVSMSQFADDLAALLENAGIAEPVVLCGLSMGGYIAFQFWRRHRNWLRALVLCDTRAEADPADTAVARLVTADRVLREGPKFLADGMIPKLFSIKTQQHRPDIVDATRLAILAADPHGVAAAARGMAERPDMSASLAEIKCPTLVMVGQEDVFSPPDGMRQMAAAIPGASFVEISSGGHMAPLENPTEANAALTEFADSLK